VTVLPYAVVVLALEAGPTAYVVASSSLEEARLGAWLEAVDKAEVVAALELLCEALSMRRAGFVPADVQRSPRVA
jgi:hypothetical protein